MAPLFCACGNALFYADPAGITPDTSFTCKDCAAKKTARREEEVPAAHAPVRHWGKKRVREYLSRNHFERLVENRLRELGCRVYRQGWPDYLAVRDGIPFFIEVKHGQDKLNDSQIEMHEVLREIGLKVRTVSLNNPNWKGSVERWINEESKT